MNKGAWILRPTFLYKSLEFGDWISEKDCEAEDYPTKEERDNM